MHAGTVHMCMVHLYARYILLGTVFSNDVQNVINTVYTIFNSVELIFIDNCPKCVVYIIQRYLSITEWHWMLFQHQQLQQRLAPTTRDIPSSPKGWARPSQWDVPSWQAGPCELPCTLRAAANGGSERMERYVLHPLSNWQMFRILRLLMLRYVGIIMNSGTMLRL